MNFVIPMAGKGDRFKNAGYNEPKMLIEVHNRTLLEWSMASLPMELCTKLIFVILKEHERNYNLTDFIKEKYNKKYNLEFVFLDKVTRGQAETVLAAKSVIDARQSLLIFNIDTFFCSKKLKNAMLRNDIDGVIGAFKSSEDRFSFACIDSNGYVEKTAEKIPISNYALTGLYHFSYANFFFEIAEEHIKKDITTKGEFYIAPMYNDLIKKGKKFVLDMTDEHWILGTPDELGKFQRNYVNKKS